MKNTKNPLRYFRSAVGKGLNLSTRVERQAKGTGAYSRKMKHRSRMED